MQTDKEWLDELESKPDGFLSGYIGETNDIDRLIEIARKASFRKAGNIVDDALIKVLEAKIERYEKALKEALEMAEEDYHSMSIAEAQFNSIKYGIIEALEIEA